MGALVLVTRNEREWSCGYISNPDGGGPGWLLSKQICYVKVEENPSLYAWLGTWKSFDNHLTVTRGTTGGQLKVTGEAYWHSNGGSVHVGDLDGSAVPNGNKLHYTDGQGESACSVDMTLAGQYMVLDDNGNCGGANVRFWGIWKRAK